MALLSAPGWSAAACKSLERLIRDGSGRRLPVVFDFDNTLVWGDIGEATLAVLVRDGTLQLQSLPEDLVPSFSLADGSINGRKTVPDLTQYYDALLALTAHGAKDPTPFSNGYTWAVEAMRELTLRQVIDAVQKAWALSKDEQGSTMKVSPGGAAFPIPFFYPEMIELVSQLMRHDFDLWIVSASNVWSVRWVVSRILNPRLRAKGVSREINPDHVVGVSALLSRPDGKLYKDALLVREEPAYAALEETCLHQYRITRWLQFPVPTYSGKVAAIWDALRRPPFLGVGDSPGDLAMLSFCQNRLWIERVEKPAYRAAMERTRESFGGDWIVQPVRTEGQPGFIST